MKRGMIHLQRVVFIIPRNNCIKVWRYQFIKYIFLSFFKKYFAILKRVRIYHDLIRRIFSKFSLRHNSSQ